MGIAAAFDSLTRRANVILRKRLVHYSEIKNIKRKRQNIQSVTLSNEEVSQIDNFFKKHYGKTIRSDWHRLYQSYTGAYHYDYFPEIIFSTELEPKLNPYHEAELLGDKNMLPILFAGVPKLHIPQTYISCVKGRYRDANGNYITRTEAVDIVAKLDAFCAKKSRDTSSGRDVQIVSGGVLLRSI